MHPSPKQNRTLILVAATVIGNASLVRGAEPICSAALDPAAIARDLDKYRPTAIGPDERASALRALPPEGEVRQLNPDDTHKLEGLADVLRMHDRQSVYTVVVVDLPQARMGLSEKSIVLISLPMLRRLSDGELQAMIAHEIGHEYVWDEYHAARQRRDESCLRRLELFCDAVAAITLHRAGLDPRHLTSGLSRISAFNRQFGTARDENSYPPSAEREAFITKVIAALPKKSGC